MVMIVDERISDLRCVFKHHLFGVQGLQVVEVSSAPMLERAVI